jgi:hypothetical protein
MKNIIAYSLWGESDKYWKGAEENIKGAKKYFPDFICRFYVDKKCNSTLLKYLYHNNAEIIIVDSDISWHGMFWRFYAAAENDLDCLLIRDTDSRFSDREFFAVNEWLKTDKKFHIMRDHPYHGVPILGGMWGCKGNILSNMGVLIGNWCNHTHTKGNWRNVQVAGDQDFLGQIIYPIVVNNALEHSEFNLNFGGNIKTFPTKRIEYEFVGDVFDENNNRHPDYWKIIREYDIRNRI